MTQPTEPPLETQPQPSSDVENADLRSVEQLTLAELLASFFNKPRQTSDAFFDVLQSQHTSPVMLEVPSEPAEIPQVSRRIQLQHIAKHLLTQSRLPGYLLAFLLVLFGNVILSDTVDARRTVDQQLASGTPFLILGAIIWFLTEFIHSRQQIIIWWQQRKQANPDPIASEAKDTPAPASLPWYERIPLWRFGLAAVAVVLSTLTFIFTGNNTFTTPAFYLWFLSILAWCIVFAPLDFRPQAWASECLEQWNNFRWDRYGWVVLVLVIILGAAMYFRFYQLDNHPLEMTDDHVEKILDAGRVRDGARDIFFANNGGREPMQMYLIALISGLPSFGINHDTIKFVSSVESLLTIPALFWMGYVLFEGEPRRRRLLIALILAALAAVSYWHVVITRQGLRIPLTPLIVAIHLIYLLRGIRHNRRSDFILAGVTLGFGLYMYQAVRMLPIVDIVAIIIALIFNGKTWRQRLTYIFNFSVLVSISFVIFVPMFRYSVDFPEEFWRRTTGRLLGDDIIQEVADDGTLYYRNATVQERIDAFYGNFSTLTANIGNVLLMFNWEGDIGSISGVSNRPSMDVWSASLLLVGSVAWIAFALRRRDSVYWLVPVIAFLMLMPSALSIAAPHENPSHTRTSGAIPMIYLIASLPLALFAEQLLDELPKWRGRIIAGLVCVGVIAGSANANRHLYFEVYPEHYRQAFNPYSVAGQYLYGYMLTGGAYGNAFLIGYEHWWSHRAIGLEGGLEEFWTGGIYPYENGQYSTDPIVRAIYTNLEATGTFRFQPSADLLFFYSPQDEATAQALQTLFPEGQATERQTYDPNEPYMVYEVPALGLDGLQQWIQDHPLPS